MIIGILEIMISDYVYALNFNQLYYIHNTHILINIMHIIIQNKCILCPVYIYFYMYCADSSLDMIEHSSYK